MTSWNEGCVALFGVHAAQAIGSPPVSRLADDSRAALDACMSELPGQCDARDVAVLHPSNPPQEQKLPLTHLRLARAAVHQISSEPRGGVVARALIDVAHDLRVRVIAKGVETRQQMEFLREHACDELQGLYFSEPLPESALQELLLAQAPD